MNSPSPECTSRDDSALPSPVIARFQRNLWLLVAMGAAFILGTPVTRLLESYRGIVLAADPNNAQMYLAFGERVPRWVRLPEDANVRAGVVLEKARGAWNPQVVETRARDMPLVQLYNRYTSTYEALIVRIDAPVSPGLAATAVLDTDAGKRLRIPLGAEHLATAAAGRRVRKLAGSWDPILLDDEPAAAAPH